MFERGKFIRKYRPNPSAPVRDVDDIALQCRAKDMSVPSESLPIVAGTDLIIHWHHFNDTDADNVISPSHRGPCIVYMAPLESNGQGFSWFKIYGKGYDTERKLWCTDLLRENHGKLAVKIPTQINNGEYLVRAELFALHRAKDIGGAQFFPNCFQISVTGAMSGSPELHSIPGIYKATDPGILYDRSKGQDNYIVPGPPVYSPRLEPAD
ncbi:hypothetical protein GGI20_003814 [Coemansia sp. BCRC 34301]|nr:hypothetical protein GGI20_003814 [Coemansia sp. BCRC 34301]